MSAVRLVKGSSIQTQDRGGAEGGQAGISWAIDDKSGAKLPCGFGTWHLAKCDPKTLNYDEVILVLEGTFGVESDDGSKVEGRPGDVIEIPRGTTVKYFGENAKLFFVITEN